MRIFARFVVRVGSPEAILVPLNSEEHWYALQDLGILSQEASRMAELVERIIAMKQLSDQRVNGLILT
jgi:hypothetical protein